MRITCLRDHIDETTDHVDERSSASELPMQADQTNGAAHDRDYCSAA